MRFAVNLVKINCVTLSELVVRIILSMVTESESSLTDIAKDGTHFVTVSTISAVLSFLY